jgi:hypothetical protein
MELRSWSMTMLREAGFCYTSSLLSCLHVSKFVLNVALEVRAVEYLQYDNIEDKDTEPVLLYHPVLTWSCCHSSLWWTTVNLLVTQPRRVLRACLRLQSKPHSMCRMNAPISACLFRALIIEVIRSTALLSIVALIVPS